MRSATERPGSGRRISGQSWWFRPLGVTVRRPRGPYPWLKPGIFLGGLVPLAYAVVRAWRGELGANPIAQVENELGLTALIFLVATLACTPTRRLFHWTWQMRVRRLLGLFAFFYASLHFLTYVALDQVLDLQTVVADVAERPFITVGFLAFVLMIPMAITSTSGWVRRLGYRRWALIHLAIYPAAVLASIHFIWRVKIDVSQPLAYAAVVAALLAVRVGYWVWRRHRRFPLELGRRARAATTATRVD